MVSRIKQLLDWQQLSPTQFADRIGIGRPVISHILSERNKPSLDVVQRILSAFPELSTNWLIKGEGEMLATSEPSAPSAPLMPAAPLEAAPAVSVPVVPVPTAVPAAPFRPASAPTPPTTAPAPTPAAPAATTQPTEPTYQAPAPKAAPRPAIARFAPTKASATPTPAAPSIEPVVAPVAQASTVDLAGSVNQAVDEPIASPAALDEAPVPPLAPTAATPTAPAAPAKAAPSLADVFGESGKAIRRIVIFYRDGSFADYQPEG